MLIETGTITVTLESPLHLASGAADVNVDADIVHDALGLPYFPARRLRGLLYESAVEVAEMGTAAGVADVFAAGKTVEALFHHDGGDVHLMIDDLHLPEQETIAEDWEKIFDAYAGAVRPEDVLAAYTGLRMQTALDEESRADDATLRTIRVLLPNAGDGKLSFTGTVAIENGTPAHWRALYWAAKNLRRAGGHRWRGFGSIRCELVPPAACRDAIQKAEAQAQQLASPGAQQREKAKEATKGEKDAKRAKYLAKQGVPGKQKSKKKRRR